jgi:hypothetical protein
VRKFGAPSVLLGDLATGVNLGRHEETFKFEKHDNAIFVPLIGNSEVIDSPDDLKLKPQNYAQGSALLCRPPCLFAPTRSSNKGRICAADERMNSRRIFISMTPSARPPQGWTDRAGQ